MRSPNPKYFPFINSQINPSPSIFPLNLPSPKSPIYLPLSFQTSLPLISCSKPAIYTAIRITFLKSQGHRVSLALKLVLVSRCLCDKVQSTESGIQGLPKATPTHFYCLLPTVHLPGSTTACPKWTVPFLSEPFIGSHCPVHYSWSLKAWPAFLPQPFEVSFICHLLQEDFPNI